MLAFNVICAACSLCWPYVYCHFATMTTERIASISDVTYSANWYDYPPILKKYLILMIARSQEEIFFSGFGFVYCTLEILLKVRVVFFLENHLFFNALFLYNIFVNCSY